MYAGVSSSKCGNTFLAKLSTKILMLKYQILKKTTSKTTMSYFSRFYYREFSYICKSCDVSPVEDRPY